MKILLPFFILLCLMSLSIGAYTPPLTSLFSFTDNTWLTLTASRFPRLLTLVLSGAGLAISGVVMQQVVQNRFVEPATSGGLDAAKLGILIATISAPDYGTLAKAVSAFLCCFLASLVFVFAVVRLRFKHLVLIPVIGLMFGVVLTSIAEFCAYQYEMLQNMRGWLLGDLSKIVQGNYELIYLILPLVLIMYFFASRFTLMGMGKATAISLGIHYKAMMLTALILVSLVVSAIVITIGTVPFVGLVVPNLVAMRYGDSLGSTLPIIGLVGAGFVIFCDIVGRLLIYPYEVPLGLTSGCMGGLLFLFLLRKAA